MGGMSVDACMPAGDDIKVRHGQRRLEYPEIPPSAAKQSLGDQCHEINGLHSVEHHVEARQRDCNLALHAALIA